MMSSKFLARALSTSAIKSAGIQSVTVIGAGIMGSGIAQIAAQSGHKVALVDQSNDLLKRAEKVIVTSVGKLAKKKGGNEEQVAKAVSDAMKNITYATDPIEASMSSDLIIEAIVEEMDIKRDLFKKLDKAVPSSTIFASNTSGLLIGSIAEATNRRDKFAGLHFFNPVPIMKLCEIISTPEVSKETIQEMEVFGKAIGKVCVHCKDTTGFIVNRLLIPYIVESIRMAERGDASLKDIDTAMKLGCGYPMGPIQLCDFSGVDTLHRVIADWHKMHPDQSLFFPSDLLNKKVAEGKFGVKTGEGFYVYNKK